MIKVNTKDYPWRSDLTVQQLLDEKAYTFRHIIVRVNGNYVPEEQYQTYTIKDNDDVLVLHLIAGG